jgi:hypothetical protein
MPDQSQRISLTPVERLILLRRCSTNQTIKGVIARIQTGDQVWRDEIPTNLFGWVQAKFQELKAAAEAMPKVPKRKPGRHSDVPKLAHPQK